MKKLLAVLLAAMILIMALPGVAQAEVKRYVLTDTLTAGYYVIGSYYNSSWSDVVKYPDENNIIDLTSQVAVKTGVNSNNEEEYYLEVEHTTHEFHVIEKGGLFLFQTKKWDDGKNHLLAYMPGSPNSVGYIERTNSIPKRAGWTYDAGNHLMYTYTPGDNPEPRYLHLGSPVGQARCSSEILEGYQIRPRLWKLVENMAVDIDESAQSYTYDGTAKAFELSGDNSDLGDFTIEYRTGNEAWRIVPFTDAGEYDVRITREADHVYAKYDKTITDGLVIEKAELTPKVLSVQGKKYDGTTTASNGVIGLEGAVNNEHPSATGIFTWTSPNAGTTTVNVSDITLSLNWGDNYKLSTDELSDITEPRGASISKVTLSPRVESVDSKEFDGTTDATGKLAFDNAVNSEKPTATATFTWAAAEVGTTRVRVSDIILEDEWATNYDLYRNSLVPMDAPNNASITAKKLTPYIVSVDAKTYDGTTNATNGKLAFKPEDVVTGYDPVIATADFAWASANAGTKTLNVTNITLNNDSQQYYTVSATLSGVESANKEEIGKYTLTPSVKSLNGKIYDGETTATGTIELSRAINGEQPTATGAFNWTSPNAGTTTVNVSNITLGTGWDTNYKLSTTSLTNVTDPGGGASISKYTLTPYVESVEGKTYDGTTTATGTIAFRQAVKDEKPTATATFTWTSPNAGANTVAVKDIKLDTIWATNYKLSATSFPDAPAPGGATISKKELTVTANDSVITYGQAPRDNGIDISGFAGQDNLQNVNITGLADITYDCDYQYTSDKFDDVGDYSLTPDVSGLSAANYTFTAQKGKLTVQPAEIQIDLESQYSYRPTGEPISIPSPTISGVQNGTPPPDKLTVTYYTDKRLTQKTTAKNSGAKAEGKPPAFRGSYYVQVVAKGGGNYKDTEKVVLMRISAPSSGGNGGSSISTMYRVEASAGTGGSIDPSGKLSLPAHSDQEFIITADKGYLIGDLLLDNDSLGPLSSFTLKNIEEDHRIEATFIRLENPFLDILEQQWFYHDVLLAYHHGLVNGRTPNTYAPAGSVTIAEAIKLAACLRQLHTQGEITLRNGDPWYSEYLDYAILSGIVTADAYAGRYEQAATRLDFARLFAAALPDDALEEINVIADGDIPDVRYTDAYGPAVYKLYRAGVLSGNDAARTFSPQSNIVRSEVAAILIRMLYPENRLHLD